MTHLSSDELIDAIEADDAGGALAPARRAHLASCDECRRQLNDLAGVLSEAKQVSVPEPSPLFWNQFSRRVTEAIDAEPSSAWPRRLRWQVLMPLGAAAAIVVALILGAPVTDTPVEPVAVVEPAAPVAPALEDSWGLFADLVGELDVETASAAGVIEPGTAEQALLQLTTDERQELSRLLQAELSRVKS